MQHGQIHRRQIEAAGFGRHTIERWIRIGWLTRQLPSVYSVPGAQSNLTARLAAAALYCRGDGLIACDSASYLWRLLDATQQPGDCDRTHVVLLGRNAEPPAAIRVHRVNRLARHDVRWHDGIPLTSPARTLLDLAGTMNDLELEAALSAAFRQKLVRHSNLLDVMERNPRAHGIGVLRTLLAQPGSLRDTRSKYERKLLALLRAAELPLPITNLKIGSKTVDGVWPDLKLAYEFDGWIYHRDKFERDRLRDQHMLIAGHQIFRISGRQIDHAPYALIARIASMITARRLAAEASAASATAASA